MNRIAIATYCLSGYYIEIRIPDEVTKMSRTVMKLTLKDQGNPLFHIASIPANTSAVCDDQSMTATPGYT